MLIILAGLPGSGKTTIAQALCRKLAAVHIRIDTIEHALRQANAMTPDGTQGYQMGYRIAADNLDLGNTVVADSVNPVAASRQAWRDIGDKAGIRTVEIEIVCSDINEHRRRVETRASDVAGRVKPRWQEVMDRHDEAWEPQPLRIDTAHTDTAGLLDTLLDRLRRSLKNDGLGV